MWMPLPLNADFAQKAFAAHAMEYGRLYAFMRDMGDRSGVSLESDLELFYLGYPLLNNTPSTAGIAVRIAAYSTLNIARGNITPKDKVFYEVTEARLSDTFGTVENMLGQSMKASPALEKRLGQNFATLKKQLQGVSGFCPPTLYQCRQHQHRSNPSGTGSPSHGRCGLGLGGTKPFSDG